MLLYNLSAHQCVLSQHSCNYHPGKWPFQHLTREPSRGRWRPQGKIKRTGKRRRGRSEERPANSERITRPAKRRGWCGRRRGRKPPAAFHIPLCLSRLIVEAFPARYAGLRVAIVYRDGQRGAWLRLPSIRRCTARWSELERRRLQLGQTRLIEKARAG